VLTNPFRNKKGKKAHEEIRQKPEGEKNRDALKRCKSQSRQNHLYTSGEQEQLVELSSFSICSIVQTSQVI
jgi:hypothetical protein